jgi:signal transduction histidine kinase
LADKIPQPIDRRDPSRALEEEADRLLVSRLRAGAWVALASITLFGIADLWLRPAEPIALVLLKLAQLAVILAGFHSLRQPHPRAIHIWIGVAAVSLLHVFSAVKGVLTDDTVVPLLMFVVMTMGAASAIPWGDRAQAVSVLAGVLSLVVDIRLVTGSYAPLLGYQSVAVVVAAVGSVYFARELERTRIERQLVGALLSGQSRVLAEIATDIPLSAVLETLCRVVEGQGTGLRCVVFQLAGNHLRPLAAPNVDAAVVAERELHPAAAEELPWALAVEQRRLVVRPAAALERTSPALAPLLSQGSVRSIWSAPILAVDGTCLGAFAIMRPDSEPPSGRDLHVIGTATFLARVVFERTEAEAALRSSRLRLESEAQVSAALVRAGNELISVLEQPIVLDRLCQLTVELVGCDFCHAWVLSPDRGAFIIATGHGEDPTQSEVRHLRLLPDQLGSFDEDDVRELAVATGSREVAEHLRRRSLSSLLCVALRRGQQIIGVLEAGFRAGRERPSDAQRRVARGIGQLAAVALENSRLVAELEQASRLKSEFVSTMSHELRTPLNVVIGYADILAEESRDSASLDLIARIRAAGRELLDLIEATLDLSRIEAGQAPPRLEEFRSDDLFTELAAEFAALTRSGGPTLEWPAIDVSTLRSDRRKLKIILKNLVGNALKFTPTGRVSVGAECTDERLLLTVRDTGIGIPAESLPTIFEMFRQVDSSDSRSYSGVGLGLYIVRRLVEQLGGEVTVESEVGRGSTFRISLPLGEARPSPAQPFAEGIDERPRLI